MTLTTTILVGGTLAVAAMNLAIIYLLHGAVRHFHQNTEYAAVRIQLVDRVALAFRAMFASSALYGGVVFLIVVGTALLHPPARLDHPFWLAALTGMGLVTVALYASLLFFAHTLRWATRKQHG